MANNPNLLEVEDVAVRRGDRLLFANLSFGLQPGNLALVVGPNGCGKTTFLRTLAGLAPCATGRIAWKGDAIERLVPEQRAELIYQGHLDGLKKDLTIRENLAIQARLRGRGDADLIPALSDLRLEDAADRQVRRLSAGQRRRAALAALSVATAQLWVLDEPMTNLDGDGRRIVGTWLERHIGTGGIAVVATHQPEELSAAAALMVEL